MAEQNILELIEKDEWMMTVVRIAASLNFPDWVIGAGFVRNKVWDHLSGNDTRGMHENDIDLVYFDPKGNNEEADERLSKELQEKTGIKWEVVNEYYAHKFNNFPPYASTEDALSQWVETATAIGVTLGKDGKLKLVAPYGVEDLVNFVVRLSPNYKGSIEVLKERVANKEWQKRWPQLTIIT